MDEEGSLSREIQLTVNSRPESRKWETPIRQEPGNWEKTPGGTAGLPSWPAGLGYLTGAHVGKSEFMKLESSKATNGSKKWLARGQWPWLALLGLCVV